MKNFRGKLLSMFMICCVIASSIPIEAKAESETVSGNEIQIETTSENGIETETETETETEIGIVSGNETEFATETETGIENDNQYVNNTGNTYYIDADNGDDANSGLSEQEAWQSLDNMNATTFEAGDAILLKRGCTWTDTFVYPKGSGDAENQNYISCYGDESLPKPVIITNYTDTMENLPSTNASIYLGGKQQYWTIENLDITVNSVNATSIVQIESSVITGIILRNCTLSGGGTDNWKGGNKKDLTGIVVNGTIKDILIENNEIYNCKSIGISVNGKVAGCDYKGNPNANSGKNVVVRNNYLENIGADGIFINNCYEPLVEYNVVNRSHSYVTDSSCAGIWPFACYGALLQYNEAYDTRTIYDGQGFDCDYNCYYTTFQYNYSHDNNGGFMLICVEPDASWMPGGYAYNVGSTVRYNISQNDHHYTFTLYGAIQETRIYNNTIYSDYCSSDSSGTDLLTCFYEYAKGTNTLNKLTYADDLLIANNIFYLDCKVSVAINKATNVVYKNNLHTGRMYQNGNKNGKTTYVTDSSNQATDTVSCKAEDASGNINGYDVAFVNPGMAGTGRDSCDGYILYQDSPAIGAGLDIDDGYHACPNDFFGNAINHDKINIGAYAGEGIEREQKLYEGKYKSLIDFEHNITGATGRGKQTKPNSGIYRCIEASGDPVIVEDDSVTNKETNSTKCLLLKNQQEGTQTVSARFYVYPQELENANGFRVYLDTQGGRNSFTMRFKVPNKTEEYSKTITVSKTGWYTFTFNEKYKNSDSKRVTPEEMRSITEIEVSASLSENEYIYVDDIQVNLGEMDEEMSKDIELEEEEETILINDFESEKETTTSDAYGTRVAGPTTLPAITTYEGRKALQFLTTAHSTNATASFGYKWSTAMEKLRNTITDTETSWDGLLFDIQMIGYVKNSDGELEVMSDDDMYICDDYWNRYTVSLISWKELTYETEGGNEKTVKEFKASMRVDKNNKGRIAFDKLYTTYTENNKTYTVYLKDFSEEEILKWEKGVYTITFSYTTCGGRIGKSLATASYLYSVSAYRGIKHEESDWRVLKEASCTEEGKKVKVCVNCGTVLETAAVPAYEHQLQEVIVAPTCTEDGYQYSECTQCDYKTEKEVLSKTGHESIRIVDKEATCTADGEAHDICKNCGIVIHELVILGQKDHKFEWKTTIPATQESEGEEVYSCIYCQQVQETRSIPQITDPINTPATGTNKVTVPGKGSVLSDDDTMAMYKVIVSDVNIGTVEYVSSTDTNTDTIMIPDTVTIDGIQYTVTGIADRALKDNNKIVSVVVGNNITTIGKEAFCNCTKLKKVELGANVQTIGASAFAGCKQLSGVTWNKKLTEIGKKAFYKCSALKKITIPASVIKIGKSAFASCKNLKTITIKSKNLTSKSVGSNAFKGIHNKAVIKVPKKKLDTYKDMLKKKGITGQNQQIKK